ncbi:hypothetical protein OG533_38950 [Streptomyces sp. NBC_01186]|uniref:hypothetical protein n=1 Tax=Streptomyces sp. NBC_01186 TaxID=2903765 RepID=UPI002E0D7C1E|nr:hypothetical protein OG533_38950 [Streptomyces sp. NBC_01186]
MSAGPGLMTGAVAALGVLGWAVDRALLWLEARGWVYWRKGKGLKAMGADLMMESSPAAQALQRATHDERMRKNVRPAREPSFDVDLAAGLVRIRHLPEDQEGKGHRHKRQGVDV